MPWLPLPWHFVLFLDEVLCLPYLAAYAVSQLVRLLFCRLDLFVYRLFPLVVEALGFAQDRGVCLLLGRRWFLAWGCLLRGRFFLARGRLGWRFLGCLLRGWFCCFLRCLFDGFCCFLYAGFLCFLLVAAGVVAVYRVIFGVGVAVLALCTAPLRGLVTQGIWLWICPSIPRSFVFGWLPVGCTVCWLVLHAQPVQRMPGWRSALQNM